MLNDVLNEIYEEKVKPKNGEIPKKLFDATVGKFEEATAKGMSKSKNEKIADDKAFLKKYRHTIDVFSAFRSHAYAKQMADQLYDKKGNVIPFEEWVEKTKDIQTHFNKTWLKTEYDTAVIRGQQAADWRMFEDQKEDYPRLRWMPTASATPREVHRVFWEAKLTLPVNDRFWDRHHPGDQWNCKCWLEQTTDPSTPIKDRPSAKDYPKPADGLDSRATKEMFSRKHPYYPNQKTCVWLKLAQGKGAKNWLGRVVDAAKCIDNCNLCEVFNQYTILEKPNKKDIDVIRNRYNSYDESKWEKISFSEETGGYNVYSKTHQFSDVKASNSKLSGGEAEKFVGEELIKLGKQVEFLPENGKGKGVPDLKFDDKTWDVKYVDSAKEGTIRKYYSDAKKANCVIFLISDKSKLETIRTAVAREYGKYKAKGKEKELPSVFIMIRNI